MKKVAVLGLAVSLYFLVGTTEALAQDLAITNVRIVVGNGNVVNQGVVVFHAGASTPWPRSLTSLLRSVTTVLASPWACSVC